MAPLKQARERGEKMPPKLFPRLQKRGPIEATEVTREILSAQRGFHAYKSVAPLKLRLPGQPRVWPTRFPRLQKRGPIEASGVARVLAG